MKLCKDCRHYQDYGVCHSPANEISLIDGKPKLMFAAERRSSGESLLYPNGIKCGPDGLNFEQKPEVAKVPWWKRTVNRVDPL